MCERRESQISNYSWEGGTPSTKKNFAVWLSRPSQYSRCHKAEFYRAKPEHTHLIVLCSRAQLQALRFAFACDCETLT